MARPTAHVLTLLELLQSGGIRGAAELASRLGVDERTVRRYVDHLIDLDVPVESVRGRYGGYRLAAGYRMPPLMLSDDEALAVLLGLVAGRRAGLLTAAGTASETAAAKIRRVLPRRLADRLAAVLESLAFTAEPAEFPVPETATLLAVADAVRHHRPVSIRYTAANSRVSDRVLHPYGLVAHAGRWYVTGADPGIGAERTFRLDRIADARALPGSFEPPAGFDPVQRVLSGLASAPYRHHVVLRIGGTVEQVRTRLPASVATVTEPPAGPGADAEAGRHRQAGDDPEAGRHPQAGDDPEAGRAPEAGDEPGPATDRAAGRWLQVELRVEDLGWLPSVLASLDLPFVIEQPEELRGLVTALASRLAASARAAAAPGGGPAAPVAG